MKVIFGLEEIGIEGIYLLSGTVPLDIFLIRAFETMPQKIFSEYFSSVLEISEKTDPKELRSSEEFHQFLLKMIQYGKLHFKDKKLRKGPDFRYSTDAYEMMRAEKLASLRIQKSAQPNK